jgi:hypothetical protein
MEAYIATLKPVSISLPIVIPPGARIAWDPAASNYVFISADGIAVQAEAGRLYDSGGSAG